MPAAMRTVLVDASRGAAAWRATAYAGTLGESMRAWILGAGFSRRLGGPLLPELLTAVSLATLRHRHPGTWLVEDVCAYCVEALRIGVQRGWWANAEEYISALGSGDPTHAHNLDELLRGLHLPPENYIALRVWSDSQATSDRHDPPRQGELDERAMMVLWTTAIRLIAAQCMDFVERSKYDPEAWLCYDRWVKALPQEDVLISFNYDEVVEQVFARNGKLLRVPNPRKERVPESPEGTQLLLKLHGGVNVRDTILDPPEPDSIANLKRNPAALAVPGRSKSDECMTQYDRLWELASRVISTCDSVVLVGYSCPPSDEMAKAMLIDSLAKNTGRLPVQIVLGPRSPDAPRLVAMLNRFSMILDTGLFAQDFLSISGAGNGWATSDVWPSD
jgi:hypothetical protein